MAWRAALRSYSLHLSVLLVELLLLQTTFTCCCVDSCHFVDTGRLTLGRQIWLTFPWKDMGFFSSETNWFKRQPHARVCANHFTNDVSHTTLQLGYTSCNIFVAVLSSHGTVFRCLSNTDPGCSCPNVSGKCKMSTDWQTTWWCSSGQTQL